MSFRIANKAAKIMAALECMIESNAETLNVIENQMTISVDQRYNVNGHNVGTSHVTVGFPNQKVVVQCVYIDTFGNQFLIRALDWAFVTQDWIEQFLIACEERATGVKSC